MTLKLHNTLTKQLDEFSPQRAPKVTLYTCGPTVYAHLTVGNWIAYIAWDTLVRTLMANGYLPERVMNITDVGHLVSDADDGQDKLEKGAMREGKTAWEVAEYYAEDFLTGMEKLGLMMPEHVTRATDYIQEQLELVRALKAKGYTYEINDGIYFDTSQFPTYADFAGLDLTAQRAGARVEFNSEKRHISDFALWKFTPAGETRDIEWETPPDLLDSKPTTVRMGFPGWHLECSAMAMSLLGTTLDIHTGGIDHIPVHHTNEIAQSEAASGKRFANFWLHNNHIKVGGTKISKSLGNGYTLQDIKARGFTAMDYRMFALQTHYRSEGNFTFENLEAARNRRLHWRELAALRWQCNDLSQPSSNEASTAIINDLHTALNDDLNTPAALAIIDDYFSALETSPSTEWHTIKTVLTTIDNLLGLQLEQTTPDIDTVTKELIAQRETARTNKDWVAADSIRDQLAQRNIGLRDTQSGAHWYYLSD